jgi:hypothetical protein
VYLSSDEKIRPGHAVVVLVRGVMWYDCRFRFWCVCRWSKGETEPGGPHRFCIKHFFVPRHWEKGICVFLLVYYYSTLSAIIVSIPMIIVATIFSSCTMYAIVDIGWSLVVRVKRISHKSGNTRAVAGSMNDTSGPDTGYRTHFNPSATGLRMRVIAKFVAK